MPPSIELRTLALRPPDLNAAFASHQPATRAYLARDRFALLIGAFINIVMGRYLITRGAMPGELPFLAGIMLLQAWQAALMHWAPDAYARHRTSICVTNRAIRIGGVVGRFWPVAGSPAGCQAYEQALLIIRTHSPTRALAMCAPAPAGARPPACAWICHDLPRSAPGSAMICHDLRPDLPCSTAGCGRATRTRRFTSCATPDPAC
jgi:hypothetical protein